MTKFNYNEKPQKPFGVSLAIVVSVLLFTIIPLLEIAFLISVDNMMVFDNVGRSGIDVIGMDSLRQQMIPQAIFAIVFLVIAILAWRGRPTIMRFVFTTTILGMGLLTITQQILPRLSANPALDSSREINQPILLFYLMMTILITLYCVWYLNRWASRAFYRGYYLPEDIEAMKQMELQFNPPAGKATSS